MCIPPDNGNCLIFSKMKILKEKLKLKELSMGMSAIINQQLKMSYVCRTGSKIFAKELLNLF